MKVLTTLKLMRDTKSFHLYESDGARSIIAKVYLPKLEGVAPPRELKVVAPEQTTGEQA